MTHDQHYENVEIAMLHIGFPVLMGVVQIDDTYTRNKIHDVLKNHLLSYYSFFATQKSSISNFII